MIKQEDLENGEILRDLISRFKQDRTVERLYSILRCFRDSYVWIPCMVSSVSDEDIKEFSGANIGDTVTSSDTIRLKPEILKTVHGEYLFPVFSSVDQMGDYGKFYSKIEKHSFEAMSMALAHEEVRGIIIDPFTNELIIDKDLFDMIGEIPPTVK